MSDATANKVSASSVQIILRICLGGVFLGFGIWKMIGPVDWILFLPEAVAGAVAGLESLDAFGVLRLMGFAEMVLGFQLIAGLFTRVTAAACAVLLAAIVVHIGLTPIGVRDIGLLGAALALWFGGGGAWSVDAWLETSQEGVEA